MSARIELNHRVHVLTRKEELDGVLGAGADFSDAARTALAFFRHARAPQVLLDQ